MTDTTLMGVCKKAILNEQFSITLVLSQGEYDELMETMKYYVDSSVDALLPTLHDPERFVTTTVLKFHACVIIINVV